LKSSENVLTQGRPQACAAFLIPSFLDNPVSAAYPAKPQIQKIKSSLTLVKQIEKGRKAKSICGILKIATTSET
jgi:hypothetical protein